MLPASGWNPSASPSVEGAEPRGAGLRPRRRLRLDEAGDGWRTVLGVAGDVAMYNWWDGEDPAAVYAPWRQAPPPAAVLAVDAIDEAGLGLTHLASLMGACGGLALLLALLGIYGLMTWSVSQRTHELGVLPALPLARAMASAFLGVVAVDPRTVVGVTVALGATALGAALPPLRRVVRLDPARVLRSE